MAIERDGANKTLRRYGYGLDLLSQTTPIKGPYWYHHDGLGSVTDITSATGTSLAWTEYTPYGAPRASAATSQAPVNPFRFSGQYLDTTSGLYHLRARQYDATTGRLTSTDPQPGAMADPYVSAYAYVRGNPVRFVDPSGRVCVEALVLVAGGPAGAVAGGGITLGCFVVIAAVAAAAAALTGSAIGQATAPLFHDSREDPTQRRWTPPMPNPDIARSLRELLRMVDPDIHTGLPGGGRLPEVCRQYRTACAAALVALTAVVGGMWTALGGLEGEEERVQGAPEPRGQGGSGK